MHSANISGGGSGGIFIGPTHPTASDAKKIERYIAFYKSSLPPMPTRLETTSVRGPLISAPAWTDAIQQRIRKSVRPPALESASNDGEWISQDIADAATDFFSNTADLLPGEPYLYSSTKGDLVAEFTGAAGALTAIISARFVMLFGVVNGLPVERHAFDCHQMRDEVRHLAALLSQHP